MQKSGSGIPPRITHKLYSILFQQTKLRPSIFFSFILLKQLGLLSNLPSSYSLFYLSLLVFAISCVNHYLTYSAVLSSSIGVLGPWNIVMGIIGTNQKWKLYLFWFSSCYYISQQPIPIIEIFIIVTACVISVETYRELIFDNIHNNIAYFSGFFTLSFIHLFSYAIGTKYSYQFNGVQKICVIPALSLLGYSIINVRIQKIKHCEPATIKNPSIFFQYINMLKMAIKNEQNVHSFIFLHKQKCQKPQCFCLPYTQQSLLQLKTENIKNITNQIINSLYIQSFQSHNWQHEDRLILIHKYCQFLIQSGQYPRAMIILAQTNEQVMNYFNKCENFRVRNKLKVWAQQQDYFDPNRSKISNVYQYDLRVGYVIKEIREILQDKGELWKELCKENPKLKDLQIMGRNLVNKIQDLHKYFMLTIRPCQQIISSFKCTMIYATYLMLTTNYLQFANSLTKKIQKIIEQKKSEVKGGLEYGLFLKISQNYDRMINNSFQLQIDNISTGLTQVLKYDKQKLLCKNLTILIPDEFKSIHSAKFDDYVKNVNFNGKKSSFIGQNIQLPFKTGNNQIIFLQMIASIQFNPVCNSAVVRCIVSKLTSNQINFIIDLDGCAIYKQSESIKEYLQHPLVQQTLIDIKNNWEISGEIQKVTKKTVGSQNTFSITFQPLYVKQLTNIGYKPLLRIAIKSDNFKNQKLKLDNLIASNKVKRIERGSESKENDSQTSNSSRKDSVQNVLSVLMESSSLKMETFLSITLFLLLITAIASFLIFFNLFNIWSTQVKEKSPTFTVISLINLKSLLNTAISWKYDCMRSKKSPAYMTSLYAQLYNGSSISQIGKNKFMQIFTQQQKIVNNYLFGLNSQINSQLQQLLSKQLTIQNPSIGTIPQKMSLQSIIINYLVDVYILYDDQEYGKTILSFSFISQVYQQISSITNNLTSKLEKQMVSIRNNNIIVICFISALFVSFIGPFWKFNINNKKKHCKIYSLLASIDSKLIFDEIKKLEKIESQIFVEICSKSTQNFSNTNQKFTSLHQIEMGENQKDGKRSSNINTLLQGIKKITAQQLVNTTKNKINIKIRKRAGQLQIEGSNCDKKKFMYQDWAATLFLLVFLGIIHGLFWVKIDFINKVDNHFKMSIQQLNNLEDNTVALLNSKLFSDDYNNTNKLTFLGQDIPSWIRNWIINYNSSSSFPIANEIEIKRCYANIIGCKNLFSQKIFQGLIKKGISDSYQWSKAALDPALFSNPAHFNNDRVTLQKTRYMVIFSQQLMDHLTNQRFKWSMQSFSELQLSQRHQQQIKAIFSIIFWILIVVFCFVSVLYTIWIKKSYVKEVTLLSILNKQMLYNNKRVQSFLHKLSKNY